jgi:putative MATE family efflux protein
MLGAVLRGTGDGRTPLKAAVLANIINVIAAYGLIFGHFGLPELGVAGSAWGATLGRATASIFMLSVLWRGKAAISIRSRNGWLPHLQTARELFRLGVPAAIEQILIEAGFTLIVAIVATLGTKSLAAQQISFTAMSLGFLPGIGFQITATALVGQSVGARRLADGVKAAHLCRLWSVAWTGCGLIFYVIFSKQLLQIFTSDLEVVRLGTNALRAIGISLPLWGLWMTGAGALRGSGDTRSPMIRGVSVVWLSVVLAWIGVHFLDQSITWVWATFIVTAPIAAIGNWRAFGRRAHRLGQEMGSTGFEAVSR